MEPDDRVEVEVADVEALPNHLPVDLALRRDVDDHVAPDMGHAPEAAVMVEALPVAVLGLHRPERGQVVRRRRDPMLGEGADALLDLAAAADPTSAADRIDVDAETASGVEHRRPAREPAAPARRREDDERILGDHRLASSAVS